VDDAVATRENLRNSLLYWYDRNGRDLPWRVRGGRADPYRVWLSEVMLQQTVAASVAPYFARFLELWPDVAALAGAPREDVLAAWAGLGYYSRARNLHAAAQILARDGFPDTEAGWRALPGVGAYTAAAVAAIAYDQPANVVDGNVERVIARLHAVETPLRGAKGALRALAAELVGENRPGDWAQALMDLGAMVCAPRAPKCGVCPWAEACAAWASGAPEAFPRRAAKRARPHRHGVAYRVVHDGKVWLVRRPEQGLLAGMAALPSTPWRETAWGQDEAIAAAPFVGEWRLVGTVAHVFTHFSLTLDVYESDAAAGESLGVGFWGDAAALPSVFAKACAV
jgi:A/G-specific adenine glycosylase